MFVKVYEKPGCGQCAVTIKQLTSHGVPVITEMVDPSDEKKLQELRDRGFTSFPVVETDDDEWCGFRMDKIKETINKLPKKKLKK